MLENITIGADPELFIYNTDTKSVVSSIGIIPGEKGNAWTDPSWEPGYGLEIDNILAEFNIPPCTTKEDFINSIVFMKKYIRDFVKKIDPSYDIRCRASYLVPEDQLQSKEAKLFGCSVDYNAYTEEPNPKPKGETTNLRSAGFHIHLGYQNPDVETSLLLIKYLDAYLGVPSVLLDGDTNRRSLYGKAGAFRLCDYGLEYRTLSSYFLRTKTTLTFVWDGIQRAINAFEQGYVLPPADNIQDAINNSNINEARKLIEDYNLLAKHKVKTRRSAKAANDEKMLNAPNNILDADENFIPANILPNVHDDIQNAAIENILGRQIRVGDIKKALEKVLAADKILQKKNNVLNYNFEF